MKCKIPPEILDYIRIVETEKHPVCEEQKMLAKMVRGVFAKGGVFVNEEQLGRYMKLQRHFPFRLFEWEKFCFALHCCTYWSESGLPRFPDLLLLVGRGAGKNGYLSFENFCLLTAVNNIRGYHIDVCAVSEDQAKTSFEEIRIDVLEANRNYMQNYFTWTKEVITNKKTGSQMRFRTNNAKSKDGGRQGKVDFDEYHQYENYDNVAVFTDGLGKKKHPRICYATTDGFVRGGPLDDIKERAAAILKGGHPDNGLLPFICRLDDESEASNPKMWVKANPSLPYRQDLRMQIEKQWSECKENPSLYSPFMTKRMNLPIANRDTAVTEWENITAANRELPDLTGVPCVAGIDYARSNDFVAVGLLFRDGDMRYWKTHTFVCSQSADLMRIKAPLRDWERMGLLTFINDVEINPVVVTNWLTSQMITHSIKALGIDGFRYTLLSSALEQIGFAAKAPKKNIKLIRPANQQYVEPVINSMFIARQIAWGDNPLMSWYTNNTKKATSAHGNFSYEKIEPKSRKNDGFMALVAAMSLEDELKAVKARKIPKKGANRLVFENF